MHRIAHTSQLITTLAVGYIGHPMLPHVIFQEHGQHWEIAPSLLLVHVCGTVCHFISVTVNCHFSVLPVTENAFVWLKIAAPSDLPVL